MRPAHMFVDSCEGALHDTRDNDWSKKPLRSVFMRHCATIGNAAEFKATLRAGQYAWPGGYPLYLVTSDGATFHFECAREHARGIIDSIQRKASDGFRCVACDINYEDNDLYCDLCSDPMDYPKTA